ncbi:MAG: class I SAM-dependent methyltransferase [Lentisphaerae bacterium]|nr:class I SAM-dependent methyltransferase [Lentisphaerota bacterium]
MEDTQASREIRHGKFLARGDPELTWGWGTPAGRVRALRRAELIAKKAMLGPGVRALEIGCGTGMFTEMFAKTGADIVAVDISADLLEKAHKRNLPNDRVRFVRKQFEQCDTEGPFDAVVGSSVLHHLAMPSALGKIYDLLKPGGVMSFAEPNMLNPQIFIERKFRRLFPRVSADETAFVRWRLAAVLQKEKFADIRIVPFDWLHPSVPRSLVGAVSNFGRALERIPVLREFSGSLHISAVRPSAGST